MSIKTVPLPPIQRASMVPEPWAGHPLLRPFKRLFGGKPHKPWLDVKDTRPLMLRRVFLTVMVIFGAGLGTNYMIDILPKHGDDLAEQGFLLLFGVLFAWISAGFWTGVMGFWVLLQGHDRRAVTNALRGPNGHAPIPEDARTAIIMPICNENVPTVFSGLRATYESLAKTDSAERFDFFVLSDTNQPDVRAAEQAAWTQLVEALEAEAGGAPVRVHYRWRQHRVKRKAGNVADFCRRYGHAYKYMIVLDADSVMTGDCLASLTRLMEAHPDTGIIQTAPRACGHETVHARIQQFGSRVYGPIFTAGLHYWQLGESHYWGHNAILRIAPFVEHCALAPLPGKTSLSGDVMSHDFVEAALMRRAGWRVWIAYDLEGSFEQVPPNLVSEIGRDRRWAHGNLQNSRLMFEPGLHPVHRFVFLTGVMAYCSAPLWFAFLLLSTVLFAANANEIPRYFLEPYQMFPIWPSANLKLMLTLFGLTACLLLAPKVMSLIIIIMRGQARYYGGVLRLLTGSIFEFFHSVLLAPVRMLFHTSFVLAALTGIKLDWKSPPRDDAITTVGEAARRHGLHTAFAVAWIVAILLGSASFPFWLSPILAGLLLAIPLSAWTSHSAPGKWLRKRGIFLIPEELTQPHVLAEADRFEAEFAAMPKVADAFIDEAAREEIAAAMQVRPAAMGTKAVAREKLVEAAVANGPQKLNNEQRMRLLSDAQAMRTVRQKLGASVPPPTWWKPLPDQVPATEAPAESEPVSQAAALA